jgi:hypothetical protein
LGENFEGMDRGRRRQVRGSENLPLLHYRLALVGFLVREHAPFLVRVGAAASEWRSPQTLKDLCAAEHTIVVGIGTPDDVRAVYVFGYSETIGTCLFHVSTSDARSETTRLIWYGIRELQTRGVRWLNMGGGVRPGDAIADAKRRFGARPVALGGVRQVFRDDIYHALCREAGIDRPAEHGYFPAYRCPPGPCQ